MKNTFKLIILILIISVYASCVKTNETSNNYVRITFSGKTLEDNSGFSSIMTNNSGGGVFSSFMIISSLVETNLDKDGNAIGNYYIKSVSTLKNYVTDKSAGNKNYDIDSGSVFTITKVDASIVEGNFTCKLIDGSNKIPATGSFSLKHN